jgi:hypothetical protein
MHVRLWYSCGKELSHLINRKKRMDEKRLIARSIVKGQIKKNCQNVDGSEI